MTRRARTIVVIALMLGMSLAALDTTIVGTALPSIVGKLGGYVEFFSLVSAERGADWIGTVDAGLTYALTDDIQLDAGVNVGVTRAADDINLFFGISMRF